MAVLLPHGAFLTEDRLTFTLGTAEPLGVSPPEAVDSLLIEIQGMLAAPKEVRECYTVEEVAAMVSKTPYTVREWCRHGRINAVKRSERRGGSELWSIPAEEVARYKNEGLLESPAWGIGRR